MVMHGNAERMSNLKALVIVVDDIEELEATAPIDLMRRAGIDVTVASASDSKKITGRNGIHLEADTLLEAALQSSYDLVVIPGGPGHASLLENTAVLNLLVGQKAEDKFIGAICAGPKVLKKAGVLEGKKFTSFPATADYLPDRDPESPVVVDGKLITSQGAGTAILFALSLVEALCGKAKRAEIADSVCHPA